MRIYYAHCVSIYGTKQEVRDLELINQIFCFHIRVGEVEARGQFEVVNPNSLTVNAQCDALRRDYAESPTGQYRDSGEAVMMEIFKPLVKSCQVLVFRALPDGRIPAGVYKEMEWAREASLPIIELPSNVCNRSLNVEATRQYLMEVGQR